MPDDVAGVAVVGMAGRFPGAATLERYWANLRDGVESIASLSDEELRAGGASPAALANPRYVKAAPLLDGVELFDAPFFGINHREAEILDPQQRVFLECSWAALESAGYEPERFAGSIGLFAGTGMSAYLWSNLAPRPEVTEAHGFLPLLLGNEKDYLASRTAYALNLRGPAIGVQTACSTALVAVHLACQALLDYQCDMALAGGVRIAVPQAQGYFYEEDGILSPDGHCRAFDARAGGTLFGSGVGAVVLKRLDEAIAAGDPIRAVIRGTAVNNDGTRRVGFTAPGVEGQMEVIAEALAAAAVDPDTIGYVEAHGTGTALGDPIEVEALTRAFRAHTRRRGFCALGSVKSNVGHLDAAAGIAGLIKTVLALEHRQLPPSLHFETPNPRIDFAASPFYVNDRLRDWESAGGPRRAAVSSFGMGGTNAHVVLEEAPAAPAPAPSRRFQVLVLSARTAGALERAAAELSARLRELPAPALADAAFTLAVGRRRCEHRLALVCRDAAEAAAALAGPDRAGVLTGVEPRGGRSPAFLFPGQGAQYPGMGGELYREEAAFGREIDRCAEILAPALGLDLRAALYPADAGSAAAGERLQQTDLAQASLFAVEYALARLWMSWGVVPQAMLGHSIGEYVAACLAEVFSLEDALALVAARGRLMRDLPAGAMLGVPLAESELAPLLAAGPGLGLGLDLDLAAVNGAAECVVSGPPAAVAACRAELGRRGIKARLLHTSRAFHSRAMDAIVEPFAREVERRPRQAPRIPFVSSLTGTWIRDEEATDPHYWARQLRQPVRFAAGLETLLAEPGRVLLEVGPGETLASLARRHPALAQRHAVVPALRHAAVAGDEQQVLAQAVARLWLVGVEVDPAAFYAGQRRRRLPLPTYPFERRRYWIDPPPRHPPATAAAAPDAAAPGAAVPGAAAPDAAAPPAPSRARLSTAYVAPRDPRESTIAALWQQRLGVEPVGIHDDFFELGGHSLLATRIAADVRRAFGTDLSLRELFATPTVAHLASAVAARQLNAAREPTAEAPALPPLVPDPAAADQPFPMTDVQGAYWIGRGGAFELGGVGTHSYFEAEGVGIDLERFASSLRLLIARHGMLRAVMLADGRQQVLPEVPAYEMAVLDLRDEPPAAAERQLLAVRGRMSHQVLPADRWPLFEVCATRLAGGRVRFHVSFDFLIGDAWSVQLLGDELARLYRDPAAVPPPLAATFRDYVLAAAAVAESDLFRRSLDYWRGRLDTLPPPPDLPLAAPAGSLARVQFTRRSGRLEPAAWERLKDRAARSGLTASVAVLAAFAEALAAFSKGSRFTLNLTLFNRLPLHPEVDRIVGDFTSLTLLEIDAAAATAFVDRARRIQERLWDDLDHRYVSGVRVLRELGRRHRPQAVAAPVVFTSMLTLGRREPAGEAGPAALSLDGSFGISQTPQVWLDHQVSEQAGGLLFNWDAVEELFPAGMLDDMLAAYVELLGRLADREETWREAAPLGVPAAHLALYAAANATAAPAPPGLLHGPFLEQAARQPEAWAVLSPERQLRYGELRRLAGGVGRRLRAGGVEPATLVAVVMSKGWEQVVGALGALAAGAAYLPIDAELPRERRDELLRQGEVRVALTQPRWAAALPWPPALTVLAVDGAAAADPAADGPWPEPPRGAAELAYTLFTSGSTGVPKGVMIEHRAALNTVVDVNRRFAVGPADRVLAVSSLSFDLSVYDLFGLLAAGGAVVVPEAAAARDPRRWLELMDEHRVTVWNTVPALAEMLVEYAVGQGSPLPSSLRLVLLSGDWVPVGLPGRLRGLCPGEVEVVSLGGATEASIWSILYPIGEVEPSWRSIPYGRAMANQSCEVLDARLAPRPLWVPGELYIGGLGLARGYRHDAEKTAAAFVTQPATGERLYRTGDLARWLPDGTIELLGREDLQVKIHGHRIELGEIEAALARCPGVRLAAAAAVPAQSGHQGGLRLVGYVVPAAAEHAPAAQELRARLAAMLPAYMVPADFVVLDALPLTANGKLDRRALPAPAAEPRAAGGGPRRLRTPAEELLAAIWEEVLGVAGVGAGDDFYALGGDSLLATLVASRVRERLGVELQLRDLIAAPTLAAQALAVESAHGGQPAPPLVAQPRASEVPLSFAQERLWFLERLQPGSAVYNEQLTLRLDGALDRACLAASLAQMVRRHEALRTTFAACEGSPVQVVGPPRPVAVPLLDLGALPAAARLPEALQRGAELARQRFDLERGPLLRTALLRLGPREHLLLLALHHIVCDAWTIILLVREMAAVYAALRSHLPPNLPPLALQYADFAGWQRSWLAGEVLEAQLAYWRRRLADPPPPLRLPTRRQRPSAPSLRASTLGTALPGALLGELKALGRREGATLFMTLLAGFKLLLHRYSGQDDVVVGTPIANRNRLETEPLIGLFTNTLVLRTDLSGNPGFRELLARVRETALGAFAHQDVPFERVVEELRPPRRGRATPFFDVLFVLQDLALPDAGLPGLAISLAAAGVQAPKFDLTLWAQEQRGELRLSMTYDEDAFEAATITTMLDRLAMLLARVAEDPEQRLLDVPLAAADREPPAAARSPLLPTGEQFAFEV